MQNRHKRSWKYFILAALLLGLIGLGFYRVHQGTDLDISAHGAVLIKTDSKIVEMRACQPEVELTLSTGKAEIQVSNVSAENIRAAVFSTGDQQAASCQLQVITPTVLQLSIKGGQGPQKVKLYLQEDRKDPSFSFAVVGDSQGRNGNLAAILEEIKKQKPDFLVHLGDMVPAGNEEEYQDFLDTMKSLPVPFYTVPGNHDVKNGGMEFYRNNLAPEYYQFSYHGYNFVFLNSSAMTLNDEQMSWLSAVLNSSGPAFVFLHVPPDDPLGKDHGFLDAKQARLFKNLMIRSGSPVQAVFSGHVHMFSQQMNQGVPFVVSGGGGAPLYAAPDEGGYHHFTLVTVQNTRFNIRDCPVQTPERDANLIISSTAGDVEVTAEELACLETVTQEGAFENAYGNITGRGVYSGVPVRVLIEKYVGSMRPGDTLVVYSIDGYHQEYAFENVYPQWGCDSLQGEMVLALEYNQMGIEDWPEGYRIAFLNKKGIYDNQICQQTSAPGQGWNQYASAGARWIKNVVRLEVIPCQ